MGACGRAAAVEAVEAREVSAGRMPIKAAAPGSFITAPMGPRALLGDSAKPVRRAGQVRLAAVRLVVNIKIPAVGDQEALRALP